MAVLRVYLPFFSVSSNEEFAKSCTPEEFDFFEKLCEERGYYKMGGSDHSGILGGPGCDDPNCPYEQSGMLEEDFMKIYERRLG